ncbi:MAG: metallophosphoesterase [Candidatus Symbiothrix sp.]|jgi:predicted MPP superfamily phosphohydrolase|nr:metallophosphoesterase [Candidatus Symbiothrix sp.]
MGFFVLVFIVFTAINAYLFIGGLRALPKGKPIRLTYSMVFFLFYGSFIVAMLGRNILPLGLQKILYFVGTVWLGCMFYLTIWLIISDLILLLFKKQVRKSLRVWQIGVGYCSIIILLSFGYYRYMHPEIVEKEIVIYQTNAKCQQLRVVAVSDLHLGVANDKKWLQKAVDRINRLQPDMIWIAGDVVDNNVLPLEKENMFEELNRLQSPLGTYMCLGNHEYLSGIDGSLQFLQKTNIHLLIDQAQAIDSCFWIVGRDDIKGNPKRKSLDALIAQTDSSQAVFLLDHEPYFLAEAEKTGIDLLFSGHTHEGQIWPLNLLVRSMFENPHGYIQKGGTHIFVSSGLGLWGPPFRIGTQSEIIVFTIRFLG